MPFDELTALYNRLHDVFRGNEPRLEPCDVAELVQDVARYMKPTLRERRIVFQNHVSSSNLPRIKADPILMKVVFINLIRNSVDANAKTVVVSARRSEIGGWEGLEKIATLEIIVKDDGIGIPEEDWEEIFKLFVTANKKGGTGLGLAVSRDLLHKHNGLIRVIESAPGRGTTISVQCPIELPEREQKRVEVKPANVDEGIKIIVVEDDPADADLIRSRLHAAGLFELDVYNSLDVNFRDAVKDADVVSLDLVVDGSSYKSIRMAERLLKDNPFRPVFFFTSNPAAVHSTSSNFTLGKGEEVQNILAQIQLIMILHDICLTLLRLINDHHERQHDEPELGGAEKVYQQLGRIDSLLSYLLRYSDENQDHSKLYLNLKNMISPIRETHVDAISYDKDILPLRPYLLEVVLAEQERLSHIKGVYIRPELLIETRQLKERLA
jgi:hypothetical protein